MSKKKGISPVIATVLLVAMVIVIGLIIFLWFKGIGGEVITKFGGTNIEVVCGDVEFSANYVNNQLYISNNGNVPIFGIKVKVDEGASHDTYDLSTISPNWPALGLNQGGTFTSSNINSQVGSAETIMLIPVLMGNSDEGDKAYICNENQHAYELIVY